MKVQKCISCDTQFRYKSIQKSIWSGYKPIICFNCGAIHEFKFIYRLVVSVLIVLPIFFTRWISSVAANLLVHAAMYFGYIFMAIGVMPFLIRYRLKNDNLE